MAEKFSLKDELFNLGRVEYLAGLFKSADPSFETDAFVAQVMSRMLDLELLARSEWIAEVLEDFLPKEFPKAAKAIKNALPSELDPSKTDDDFGSFIFLPFGNYAVNHGMSDFDVAMDLMHEVTRRFSMEFAMRHFIIAYPDACLDVLADWANDDSYHVRRLVSECSRPSLPWGKKIGLDVERPMGLLDQLYSDPTRFVTRSVANHLNDIAKVNPSLVVSTLRRWAEENQQDSKELEWMTRHALRTLVKKGDSAALELLGFRQNPKIDVVEFDLTPQVQAGGYLEFSAKILADRTEKLMIDFVIDFVKANAETKPKVFKLKQVEIEAGETHSIAKRHRLLANATTFKLHAGEHHLSLQINGKVFRGGTFEVIIP